jgi:hypothetical protein
MSIAAPAPGRKAGGTAPGTYPEPNPLARADRFLADFIEHMERCEAGEIEAIDTLAAEAVEVRAALAAVPAFVAAVAAFLETHDADPDREPDFAALVEQTRRLGSPVRVSGDEGPATLAEELAAAARSCERFAVWAADLPPESRPWKDDDGVAGDVRGVAWACRAMAAQLPAAGVWLPPGAVESGDPQDRLNDLLAYLEHVLEPRVEEARAALPRSPLVDSLGGFVQVVRSAISCAHGFTNDTWYATAVARLDGRAAA